MVKPRKYPDYNPEVDGNPFAWIVSQSAAIRATARAARRPPPKIDPLTGKPFKGHTNG